MPAATATVTWIANAAVAPDHTGSGRRYRVTSTMVATIVLSGSSAGKTVTKARTAELRLLDMTISAAQRTPADVGVARQGGCQRAGSAAELGFRTVDP